MNGSLFSFTTTFGLEVDTTSLSSRMLKISFKTFFLSSLLEVWKLFFCVFSNPSFDLEDPLDGRFVLKNLDVSKVLGDSGGVAAEGDKRRDLFDLDDLPHGGCGLAGFQEV